MTELGGVSNWSFKKLKPTKAISPRSSLCISLVLLLSLLASIVRSPFPLEILSKFFSALNIVLDRLRKVSHISSKTFAP